MTLRQQFYRPKAFTLVELVMATALAVIVMGGAIYGYVMSARRAEWSAYRLAANSLAMGRVEQARASKWDPQGFPSVDELVSSNFPLTTNILDIPISKTNIVYATNVTTITVISTNPPLKMIRVDTSWRFVNRGNFTNTIVTYRAADQ